VKEGARTDSQLYFLRMKEGMRNYSPYMTSTYPIIIQSTYWWTNSTKYLLVIWIVYLFSKTRVLRAVSFSCLQIQYIIFKVLLIVRYQYYYGYCSSFCSWDTLHYCNCLHFLKVTYSTVTCLTSRFSGFIESTNTSLYGPIYPSKPISYMCVTGGNTVTLHSCRWDSKSIRWNSAVSFGNTRDMNVNHVKLVLWWQLWFVTFMSAM
jgi:hypothetical protein